MPGCGPGSVVVPGDPGDEPPPPPPPDPPPDPGYTFANSYHHRDHLGNLRVVTDEAGWPISKHDYYPFGMEMVEDGEETTGGSRKRFTGHERDEQTGLDYAMARYNGSSLGRFLSVDPAWTSSSPTLPQSWNRYTYVLNSPVRLIDPDGREYIDETSKDMEKQNQNAGNEDERAMVQEGAKSQTRIQTSIQDSGKAVITDAEGKDVPGTAKYFSPEAAVETLDAMNQHASELTKANNSSKPYKVHLVNGENAVSGNNADGSAVVGAVFIYKGSLPHAMSASEMSGAEATRRVWVHEVAEILDYTHDTMPKGIYNPR